ncbi:Wzz/FepE/Etk N-terminal domain-containing protein [Poseidonibacter ostreae]|uniref:Polysaccharide chain length determinant N-terminal domain-containing protein n=1 Tax=Poseidonibacter ostreae TaxID=2654171 RepID=A0ABQ6VQ24_9BACT|nr:Wzz/FepE/Etk N-terminal domain-containing protein [Poseidonibacter ostreae]KAB7892647.1 hypothetical protein GBG18_01965 [Poseidonibacter ostreae]
MNNTNQEFIEEDEIDLRELFNTILRYKYKIAAFSFIVVLLTLFYVLSIPNSYKSEIILAPQSESKSASGGLAGLASLAGVSLGGGNSKDPFTMMQTTLKDYEFNKLLIEKYNLADKLANPQNLVFAMGIDSFYSKKEKNNKIISKEELIFSTNKSLNSILSLSSDKKSGLIVLSAEHVDRFLAKELVDIYLEELISKIKFQDMKEIDKQIDYYKKELSSTYDVSLKEQLSKSLSALMQKRVFSLANDYYFVSKLTDSRVAYIKEKTNPKRALILTVSFVTSIILGIFMAFFLEFIRSNRNDEKK